MAKLDMRKALAGAVTPLDATKPVGESTVDLRLVTSDPSNQVGADAMHETVLDTHVVDPPTVPVDASATSEAVAVTPTSPRSAPPKRPTAKPAARPGPAETSPVTAMGVDVDEALDARLVAFRASTRLSFHQIILDAVEHSYPTLTERVAKALGRENTATPQVKLFERTFVPSPVSLEGRQERVTHTIRITSSNRSMLDDIAAETKAPSRNFMICVALDHYLPA